MKAYLVGFFVLFVTALIVFLVRADMQAECEKSECPEGTHTVLVEAQCVCAPNKKGE